MINGGARCIEVTRGGAGGHWHVHLHCLISGGYAAQPVLKKIWHTITGDSFIVDIRACHDRFDAARYMAAYVAKPTKMTTWSDAELREYADAIHGVRMVQCWGSWQGADLDADDKNEPPEETAHLSSLNAVHRLAREGSEVAHAIKRRLCCIDRSFETAFGIKVDRIEAESFDWSEAAMNQLRSALTVIDDNLSITAIDFDRRIRGPGPLPSRLETQLVYEWCQQPDPDPSPMVVDQWERSMLIGEPWQR